MSAPTEEQAEEWFQQGKADFKDAKVLLKHRGSSGTICYLCQQAVEKYLKGFLMLEGRRYPRIHDLSEIAKVCAQIDPKFLNFMDEYDTLTAYYIEPRYPMPLPRRYPRKQAREAIKMAERIIKFVKQSVPLTMAMKCPVHLPPS